MSTFSSKRGNTVFLDWRTAFLEERNDTSESADRMQHATLLQSVQSPFVLLAFIVHPVLWLPNR